MRLEDLSHLKINLTISSGIEPETLRLELLFSSPTGLFRGRVRGRGFILSHGRANGK
jgi:hypothetical protein